MSVLLAAPAANARFDEGNGTASTGEALVLSADSDGFSWGDAAIGAGTALGLVGVAGVTARAVRKHSLPAHS